MGMGPYRLLAKHHSCRVQQAGALTIPIEVRVKHLGVDHPLLQQPEAGYTQQHCTRAKRVK